MTASQSASSMLKLMRSRRMPALLTRMSRPPSSCVAWLIRPWPPSQDVMSSKLATAVPPAPLISLTTSSAGRSSLLSPETAAPTSLTTTDAPSDASRRASVRPIPRPAPVMTATLPSSRPMLQLLFPDEDVSVRSACSRGPKRPGDWRRFRGLAGALAHGTHLEAGVARVEHVGVDDGPDVVRVPLLLALGVLERLLERPWLVAGDRRADGPEHLTGDVERLIRRQPDDRGRRVAGVHGVELFVLLGLLQLHVLDDGARHTGHAARGDGVGPHAVVGQLEAGDDRQGGDARLGRAVVGLAHVALEAGAGDGIDARWP